MFKKLSPKNVKICKGCPSKELDLNGMPKFTFLPEKKEETKMITIIGSSNKKKSNKITSLF